MVARELGQEIGRWRERKEVETRRVVENMEVGTKNKEQTQYHKNYVHTHLYMYKKIHALRYMYTHVVI